MFVQVATVALSGTHVLDIGAQVHIANGQPNLLIVGLGDKSVMESRERIRSAIHSLGLSLPAKRITVNLAPANLAKIGSHFDLPIAIAILVAMGALEMQAVQNYIIMGELSLNGNIGAVSGVLPASIHACDKAMGIICPHDNGAEATIAKAQQDVIAASNLPQLVAHLKGLDKCPPAHPFEYSMADRNKNHCDLSAVRGQESAKRALKIAIAGGHNILFVGTPGSGKSMLSSAAATILPPLSEKEILEINIIKSIAHGLHKDHNMICERPFRSPHHSATTAAIIGGGQNIYPGEITLAHNGILFLDELPEFSSTTLDALRQPLETGRIDIARANARVSYPANFQLIAAMNPCKCGYFGHPKRECQKAPHCAYKYQEKISGPIFDRIDIHVTVATDNIILLDKAKQTIENSRQVLQAITQVREKQKQRYQGLSIVTNSQLSGDLFEQFCQIDHQDSREFLHHCMKKLGLSMRGYTSILKVARTIADMADCDRIGRYHIAEAMSYRNLREIK